jgi:membrane protease YdiL (CAAX protease family)
MYRLIIVIRASLLAFGIFSMAALSHKLLTGSDLHALIAKQQWTGIEYYLTFFDHFLFAFLLFVFAVLVSCLYWRSLFPSGFEWQKLLVGLVLGVAFAALINGPAQQVMSRFFFGAGIQVVDSVPAALGAAATARLFVVPAIEELILRGILFREVESASVWLLGLFSVLVTSAWQFVTGGTAAAISFLPFAVLLVGLRMWSGSFVYTMLARLAFGAAVVMGLQVL